MRKSALWLVASLSIATTACVRTHTNEASGKVDVDVESPTKKGEDWKGELKGQGMFASVRGSFISGRNMSLAGGSLAWCCGCCAFKEVSRQST